MLEGPGTWTWSFSKVSRRPDIFVPYESMLKTHSFTEIITSSHSWKVLELKKNLFRGFLPTPTYSVSMTMRLKGTVSKVWSRPEYFPVLRTLTGLFRTHQYYLPTSHMTPDIFNLHEHGPKMHSFKDIITSSKSWKVLEHENFYLEVSHQAHHIQSLWT